MMYWDAKGSAETSPHRRGENARSLQRLARITRASILKRCSMARLQ